MRLVLAEWEGGIRSRALEYVPDFEQRAEMGGGRAYACPPTFDLCRLASKCMSV